MHIRSLQERSGKWAQAYKTKKERHPGFMFAHTHEEVSEAWKAWREGDLALRFDRVKKHGRKIDKPEGLGAELADAAIMVVTLADTLGVDLETAIETKFEYLDERLAAKQEQEKEKRAKKRDRNRV